MNVTPYTLDSLRKLVRDLQAENKELKALLDKSGIPYAKSNVFEESGTAAEEYDIDQGGRIQPQYIDQNLAVRFSPCFGDGRMYLQNGPEMEIIIRSVKIAGMQSVRLRRAAV